MLTTINFENFRFLEGRWIGKSPDGKDFYEQYSFPAVNEMRSTRFSDSTFSTSTDGSVVALQDGQVTSTWNEFTWELSELTPSKACFKPVKAPSSFCWELVSDNTVQVTQRWTDAKGEQQEYIVPLRRL